MNKIKKIHARQIIDSRAIPTLEVDLYLEDGSFGRAAVPSGASTGSHEALELRDGDMSKWLGKTVFKSIQNVKVLSEELSGKYFETQEALDSWLIQRDGTGNKSNLGANTILGISLAFAHAVANSQNKPLYLLFNELYGKPEIKLPIPMFNIMNGGKHANWSTDVQEFMILMPNFEYQKQLQVGCEIFLHLEKLLKSRGKSVNVGNEGGFAPGFESNEEALEYVSTAVENTRYKLGEEVFFALDIASSEFYNEETKSYTLKTEKRDLNAEEWMSRIVNWTEKYPILSIEDPFAEDDWDSWIKFTESMGDKLQIVGDDLLVTNQTRIEKASREKACNALLVKLNQIGTLTETLIAMKTSEKSGWKNIVSHRSGETEDTTIAHLAVGTGCGQIKTGAPSRGERTAKYNEILRIAENLNL
ncbi:phosphopyruvate hydratase [Candidatus Dojkabacteria bacterium]|uniref:Enolase n=1 Tax=Candidatus Dojkabacteria bacterium TaxID=2099670 RepID=A0A3M0Z3P7_9BACT|nr:MAG: phosphopyruvate hydratase [Candidatus Dojkabacteria bacterium]